MRLEEAALLIVRKVEIAEGKLSYLKRGKHALQVLQAFDLCGMPFEAAPLSCKGPAFRPAEKDAHVCTMRLSERLFEILCRNEMRRDTLSVEQCKRPVEAEHAPKRQALKALRDALRGPSGGEQGDIAELAEAPDSVLRGRRGLISPARLRVSPCQRVIDIEECHIHPHAPLLSHFLQSIPGQNAQIRARPSLAKHERKGPETRHSAYLAPHFGCLSV